LNLLELAMMVVTRACDRGDGRILGGPGCNARIGPTSAASRGREHDGRTTTDVLRPRMSTLEINNDRCQ